MHWSEKYIFRKWTADYKCWQFLIDVYQDILGVDLVRYEFDSEDQITKDEAFKAAAMSGFWKNVRTPSEFDAVAISRGGDFAHVGIWTEADGGMVVHNDSGTGVTVSSLHRMRLLGYDHFKFYRHADNL